MTIEDAKPKLIYYKTIFEQVQKKRLSYVNRIAILLTFFSSLLIGLFAGSSLWFWPLKWLLLGFSLILVRHCKESTQKLENPGFKTFFRQFLGQIFCADFISYLLAYGISGFTYWIILFSQKSDDLTYYIITPTRTVLPYINDQFVYFWFFFGTLVLWQSIQQAAFLRNKLNFQIGVYRIEPRSEFNLINFTTVLSGSLTSSVLVSVSTPILYILSRSSVYNVVLYPFYWILGLNHNRPHLNIGFGLFCSLFYHSLLLTFQWEFVNLIYDIYVRIGCIDKDKALSLQSADPVNTLLSGLKDVNHPFVQFTAFQELAYIATSSKPEDRKLFYSVHSKNSYVWNTILEECTSYINENIKHIELRMVEFDDITKFLQPQPADINGGLRRSELAVPPTIFGNSKHQASSEGTPEYDSANEIFATPTSPGKLSSQFYSLAHDYNSIDNIHLVVQPIQKFLLSYYQLLIQSSIGIPFRKTLRREAASRIKNPVLLGNIIIAFSSFLLHSQTEDKVGVVKGSLAQVLEILAKLISATGNFTDHPPLPPTMLETDQPKTHIIAIIHDLSMKQFFELAVKFNHVLNDLILSPTVFKLAKWSIDTAIEEQKKQETLQKKQTLKATGVSILH
ncbi:BA75_05110T0 [Komagataella pastoris]|uniref:BA75_05110T0 n=1 Tax=Komagataella pastoris TaxID=4922 RepID=A0A1B2JHR4_PICPA|nr:BA75_05110T0 [Komagataella pastoris]